MSAANSVAQVGPFTAQIQRALRAIGFSAGGVLAPTNGGTGLSVFAIGDLLVADSTTTLARLADVAVGSILVSGGVGTAPAYTTQPRFSKLLNSSGNVYVSASTTPTYTSGISTGTPGVTGNTAVFEVTVGATPSTSGIINFGTTFNSIPATHCDNSTTVANVVGTTPTVSQVTLTGVWLANDIIRCTTFGR